MRMVRVALLMWYQQKQDFAFRPVLAYTKPVWLCLHLSYQEIYDPDGHAMHQGLTVLVTLP